MRYSNDFVDGKCRNSTANLSINYKVTRDRKKRLAILGGMGRDRCHHRRNNKSADDVIITEIYAKLQFETYLLFKGDSRHWNGWKNRTFQLRKKTRWVSTLFRFTRAWQVQSERHWRIIMRNFCAMPGCSLPYFEANQLKLLFKYSPRMISMTFCALMN